MSPTVEPQSTCTARARKLPPAVGAGHASESELATVPAVAEACWTRWIGTDCAHCTLASGEARAVVQSSSAARTTVRFREAGFARTRAPTGTDASTLRPASIVCAVRATAAPAISGSPEPINVMIKPPPMDYRRTLEAIRISPSYQQCVKRRATL